MMTAMLTVLTGPHRGCKYSIKSPCSVSLGRHPECAICLTGTNRDGCISRRHCQFTFEGRDLHIRDLQSTNGTYLNGTRLPAVHPEDENVFDADVVHDGDVITIGGTSLRVELHDYPVSATILDCEGRDIVKRESAVRC